MPTIFSHAVAATAIRQLLPAGSSPRGLWVWTAVCAMLPDADVVGFALGVRYDDMLGHRGLSHSLVAAVAVGLIAAGVCGRSAVRSGGGAGRTYALLALYFAAVTASHGVLDALTNGGRGIAFFAPFSDHRYFFPWRPIQVSPIGLGVFSARGIAVFLSEIRWIWLPSLVVGLVIRQVRGRRAAWPRASAAAEK